ncbi:hypothetical protein NS115_08545 [Paenibacillus jamilae]|uniref:DUF3934 domain-containing protein n=2 Tax=Paenibacillus TaxID=44249 RepID=E3EHW0_PAEPS|nr:MULTISPECIES: DUF3934 family protein [Paenibacillus]ADO56452.1 hypothetical protein PPSC2_11660 [Paenibacillus polymyxa SC2]AJE49658.1 hypothetical protein RE92_00665 [Paenibacillus polymyxa]KTS83190.1 hypothetical protein NS115_08545 [Paenibacillus jamilae]OAZ43298.1 DUF3934 domain-containing protein [Paenibacillus polymyxa]QOH61964.1 DUF3934 domain-containing protein [Paenibacillus polymyxa]
MGGKSKGGGTGRGTGSKGWTRWNKTAKPVKRKSAATGAPGNTAAGAAKGGAAKPIGNRGGRSK